MKLYTKTGDTGQTGLLGGTRVPKNDIRIEAYGTVDELNSFIGLLAIEEIPKEELDFLQTIQRNLFTIGSFLATDQNKLEIKAESILKVESIELLENEIDRLDATLPELTEFILPGGSKTAALSHVCRTVSRRAERRILDMVSFYSIESQILVYFNRLSDYFFVLSRYFTKFSGAKEIYWKRFDY